MYSYNIESDIWILEGTLPLIKNMQIAWFANGKIYLGGGRSTDNSTYFNRLGKYDPSTQTWIDSETIPLSLYGADSVVLNDKIYLVGRSTGTPGVYSNKVFAADLNASVEGVHDLYIKTGDASSGTPTVQAEVADGSIGPSKLSSEVSNALKPVVVGQPSSVVGVDEQSAVLDVDVDGVNLSYQWKKNGVDITGATSHAPIDY